MGEPLKQKNFCQFNGRLVRDANTLTTRSGRQFVVFTIAISNDYLQGQQWVKDTCYLDVNGYNTEMIALARYLRKGTPVNVCGRLKQTIYQSKKYGHDIISTWLLASHISLTFNEQQPAAPQPQKQAEPEFPPKEFIESFTKKPETACISDVFELE